MNKALINFILARSEFSISLLLIKHQMFCVFKVIGIGCIISNNKSKRRIDEVMHNLDERTHINLSIFIHLGYLHIYECLFQSLSRFRYFVTDNYH